MVERSLSMREVPGSIPGASINLLVPNSFVRFPPFYNKQGRSFMNYMSNKQPG